jgi:hypothetical protein
VTHARLVDEELITARPVTPSNAIFIDGILPFAAHDLSPECFHVRSGAATADREG